MAKLKNVFQPAKTTWHVLNLGAGVQSTALYLMASDPEFAYRYDAAVFTDTQAEPKAVYEHLRWMRRQPGPPILTGTAGNLKHDLLRGKPHKVKSGGGTRFVSIPAFLKRPDHKAGEKEGQIDRQCTKEYKIEVVQRIVRRQVIGIPYRARIPAGVTVYQYFGFSVGEEGRAARTTERFRLDVPWSTPRFPLLEIGMTRKQCREYLLDRVPHRTPRSACTFCPYHDDAEWALMKATDPDAFAEACEVDDGMREPDARCRVRLKGELYLHRSLIPLRMVDFSTAEPAKLDTFGIKECYGMCGN